MSGIESELSALGVGLAFVGTGSPAQAQDFAGQFGVKAPIYVDPGRRVYEALSLAHGVGATFNWKAISHGMRAISGGWRQGALGGDPWQQGGVFLVLPDGSMPYAYRSTEAGDHPAPGEVLAAAKAHAPPLG